MNKHISELEHKFKEQIEFKKCLLLLDMQLKDSLVKNVLKLHSIRDEVFLLKGIKMKSGYFYFIYDQYFIDFECKELPLNKSTKDENIHNRPCFYVIKGTEENIYIE